MSDTPHPAAPAPSVALQAAPTGRVVSIDILRGLAILWVIVYHLYGDMTYRTDFPALYPRFRDQVLDGRPLAALTAFGELILGQGYLGVALFMMLSGLSLAMNAELRGEPGALKGYATRFRRVLPVYWAGVLLILSSVAFVALLQVWIDGGSFRDQWFDVRISAWARADIHPDDVWWALSVVPWVFRDKLDTVPVGSLWFVELLLQYYLIFPFALMALRKAGPWRFALAGVALTLALRAIYVPWAFATIQNGHATLYLWALAPFRGWEFFIGMSIGYLLARRRDDVSDWVRSPFDTSGLLVIGVLCVMGGVILAPWSDQWLVVGDVWIHVGLALVIVPLLFKAPGWLEASAPARALVFLGVVSFTALIINDMMRYIASFLRIDGVTGPPWWLFLWVVYVPIGTLLAYPLAAVFGLLPQQRARASTPAVAEPSKKRRRGATAAGVRPAPRRAP